MLFASVNRFISQFALDKVQEHMALFNLTARPSLPVLFGSLWDFFVSTSSRKDCGRVRASPLMIQCPLEYQTWRLNTGRLQTANSGPGASEPSGQAAECSYQSFHKATSFPL